MHIKIITTAVLLLSVLPGYSVLGSNVRGLESAPTTKLSTTQAREREQERERERESQKLTEVCTKVTAKVTEVTSRYSQAQESYKQRYETVIARVERIITNLQSKNIDITKIQSDLAQLKEYASQFYGYRTSFQNALNESKELVCGQSQGAYKAKMEEARGYMTQMRTTAEKIHTFLKSTLKTDLTALKTQLQAQKTENN